LLNLPKNKNMISKTTGLLLFSLITIAFTGFTAKGKTIVDPPVYRQSLEELQKTVPLTYNEYVKKMINVYSSSHKARFSKMTGLSQYYFPIYEKIFKDRGVPDELKYLSVVESSLNCQASSWVGATGPWQFLYEVGKIYGLTINDSVDERKDPVLACNAAASYLLDSYNMYGDWLLAIASYNCGRNNIRWAMEKAEGATDYWSIRQYLPVETQNYVPAYIATVYMMNNYKKHGIRSVTPDFSIYTKDIEVSRPVSFESISKAVNVKMDELLILNPSYKGRVINGTAECPKRLVVPVIKTYLHDALAVALHEPAALDDELKLVYTIPVEAKTVVAAATVPAQETRYVAKDIYVSYKVQDGDTLSSIAEKFQGTEEEIKVINRLKHYNVKPGMVLKIIQG